MTQILVIAYPNDWHWALTLEYANSQVFEELEVWDISWVGERGIKNFLKMLLGGNKFQRNCKSWLKSKGIPAKKLYLSTLPSWKIRSACKDFLLKDELIDPAKYSKVYNTLVESTGTLRVDVKTFKKQILRELISSMTTQICLDRKSAARNAQVVTVNGRFTKNATVKEWAESRSLKRLLLEFGSTLNSFEVFQVSPHSVSELSQKLQNSWELADKNQREEIAIQYLDALKANKVSAIHWREKIEEHRIPDLPMNKKICVFFASTEVEHAGAGDKVPSESFESQERAFSGLVEALPSEEWHLYVRRHPKNPMNPSKDDPESELWDQFRHLSNVTIIEPDSPIDSIALGMSADLVTNYWSTIAIEMILQGHPKVITLGPAPWNSLLKEFALTDVTKIADFLSKTNSPIQPKQIYPWAYFQATFGQSFQLFDYCEKIGRWKFKQKT